MRTRLAVLFIIIISLVGMLFLLTMTRWGIGTSPDSIIYIGTARNLVDGKGLTVPFGREINATLTQFPPMYPIILALIGIGGVDPLVGARLLNAILYGLLIAFIGLSLRQITQNGKWTPIVGMFLGALSAVVLGIHTYAWTEPLFIILSFGGLAALAAYLVTPKLHLLIGAAIAIGLATLTRFVGVAVIAAGCLGVVLLQNGKFLKRIRDVLIFGSLSSLPLFLWLIRNTLSTSSMTSRDFAYHPITRNHILQALHTVSTWALLPVAIPGFIKVIVLSSIFFGILWIIYFQKRSRNQTQENLQEIMVANIPPFVKLLIIFIFSYTAFLLFSISFFDANTPLDDRILSPIFVALIILLPYFVYLLLQQTNKIFTVKVSVIIVTLFFSAAYLLNGISIFKESFNQGLGFSSLDWKDSEFVDQINRLHADTTVYSNAPYAVYILSGKSALSLPKQFLSMNQQLNEEYETSMAEIGSVIHQSGGAIVFFDLFSRNPSQTKTGIQKDLSLQIVFQTDVGTIFEPENQE